LYKKLVGETPSIRSPNNLALREGYGIQ